MPAADAFVEFDSSTAADHEFPRESAIAIGATPRPPTWTMTSAPAGTSRESVSVVATPLDDVMFIPRTATVRAVASLGTSAPVSPGPPSATVATQTGGTCPRSHCWPSGHVPSGEHATLGASRGLKHPTANTN